MLGGHALNNRSADNLRCQLHPSVSSLSCRVLTQQLPPHYFVFRRGHYLPRFSSSSRHNRKRPLRARVPMASLVSVLRLSQPLDGLLRFAVSQAYFILQATCTIHPVQGVLAPHSTSSSSEDVAPMPFQLKRSPTEISCRVFCPRLRGFTLCRVAFPSDWD
jgi:hypothetical protein